MSDLGQSGDSGFAAREAALDRINDDPAWAQRAYGSEETAMTDHKIRVPPSTARNIENAAVELGSAIRRLQEAGDRIKTYSPRMQFKAADLAEQTAVLRAQVLELRGDLEVVDG